MQSLRHLHTTLEDRLHKHGLGKEGPVVHLLDGQLIDSMQTTSKYVSYLMATTTPDIYHEGTYYVGGGLYRVTETLADSIRKNGGILKKNRRILSMKKTADGPLLTSTATNTTPSILSLTAPSSSRPLS